jgi:hypothetical protein
MDLTVCSKPLTFDGTTLTKKGEAVLGDAKGSDMLNLYMRVARPRRLSLWRYNKCCNQP